MVTQTGSKLTSLHKDFISRCLRMEINCLQSVLDGVENPEKNADNYLYDKNTVILEGLKVAETKLNALIKYLSYS